MSRIILSLAAFVLTLTSAQASVVINETNFPDPNLRERVAEYDFDSDGVLSDEEIENCREMQAWGAKNLKGLEIFSNLETIILTGDEESYSSITSFDAKPFKNLGRFDINNYAITSLDLTYSNNLWNVEVNNCRDFSAIKTTSNNDYVVYMINLPKLTDMSACDFKNARGLEFKRTGIQDIDVSNHPTLQWLSVAGDYNADGEMIDYELNSVNVAGCNALWELGMGNVKLQSVRLSGLPIFYALQLFQCNTQNLSVENMANLGGIECSGCSIQNLTIKNCPVLTGVGCADNNLHNLIIDDSPHLYSVNAENNKLMWLDMSHVENYDVSDVSWFKVDNQTPSATAWKLSPTEVGLRVHERMDPARMLNLKTNGKSVTASETFIDGIRYIVFSNEGANAETLRGKTSTYEYETKWPYAWVEENSKDNNLPVSLYISNVEKPASWIRLSTNSVTALWKEALTAPTVTRSQDYDGKLTFSSGNEAVVKVNAETGELTPVGPGRATITVTGAATDYRQAPSSVSYTVYINVREGDVNRDGMVDVADISTILSVMAGSGLPEGQTSPADVNNDKTVDVADISSVLSIMAASARMMMNED